MTNQEIFDIALEQSAYDCNCTPEDFLKDTNVITLSQKNERARKYIPLPLECDLVSYGNNIVAQVSERLRAEVEAYINRYSAEHCFETPNMHILDEALKKYDLKICFMAEYFLPDISVLTAIPCQYELRILQPSDFEDLYTAEWGNALTEDDRQRDMLAVGAYDKGRLAGLAGCSADCDKMYQIGVDVLPEYRRQGIASALTSRLALEILALGKVPFYCAAWSNIKSVRNAIKSGFRPAWVELTGRSTRFVDKMNGKQ
ncbi:MAG: GNAT family N-acetyltransferase [Clostridium sp.]|nr:GNAT family N-acetyltransferase [Clostridium sp.]